MDSRLPPCVRVGRQASTVGASCRLGGLWCREVRLSGQPAGGSSSSPPSRRRCAGSALARMHRGTTGLPAAPSPALSDTRWTGAVTTPSTQPGSGTLVTVSGRGGAWPSGRPGAGSLPGRGGGVAPGTDTAVREELVTLPSDPVSLRVVLVEEYEVVRRGVARVLEADAGITIVGEAGSAAAGAGARTCGTARRRRDRHATARQHRCRALRTTPIRPPGLLCLGGEQSGC